MTSLMDTQENIRNICFIGQLHHGKTTLMDMLLRQTHTDYFSEYKEIKYTDNRLDEQTRGISIKSVPMSFLLPNSKDKVIYSFF
jgi:116 kDa U5 small nuclear ribonucleoprotein component